MNEVEFYIGELALELVPVFSGSEEQSAKWFIRELEEALDLSNITIDKFKKYYFKEKLKGSPLQWYESVRVDDDYQSMTWDLLKKKFLKEFDTIELRLKDMNRLLMNCCQNEEENVRSYYIRITKLFNEFKQISEKSLTTAEQVEYFINGSLPNWKQQLNNCFQNAVGCYLNVSLEEVLEKSLIFERNWMIYNLEIKKLSIESGETVDQMRRINVVNSRNENIEIASKEQKETIENIETKQDVNKPVTIENSTSGSDINDEIKYAREKTDDLYSERLDNQSEIDVTSEDRFTEAYNIDIEEFNKYTEKRNDSSVSSEVSDKDLQICSYNKEVSSTIGRQIEREESLINANKQNENQYEHLMNEVDVNSSKSCNSMLFSVNVVKYENTMKEVEKDELNEDVNEKDANSNSAEQYKLYSIEGVTVDNVTGRNLQLMDFKVKAIDCYYYGINSKNNIKEVELVEETHKEERIYGRKCEINEEVNKSDVNYNSVNQYCFSSIEAADKDRKKNFKLMDSEVKSNDCYNCFDEHKELENSERNEEEKIMSVLGKEPKPPWKITMFTKQEEKRDNICC